MLGKKLAIGLAGVAALSTILSACGDGQAHNTAPEQSPSPTPRVIKDPIRTPRVVASSTTRPASASSTPSTTPRRTPSKDISTSGKDKISLGSTEMLSLLKGTLNAKCRPHPEGTNAYVESQMCSVPPQITDGRGNYVNKYSVEFGVMRHGKEHMTEMYAGTVRDSNSSRFLLFGPNWIAASDINGITDIKKHLP